MRQKIVMGNWKMNGSLLQINALLSDVLKNLPNRSNALCVVLPPSIYLPYVTELLRDTQIQWGAQNIYPQNSGAYTGEISASMLTDYACRYVLVGHSERRHLFHEDEKFIAEKFHHVKDHDMIPVLCVGETLTERQQGLTEDVISRQILSIARAQSSNDGPIRRDFKDCIIAYEPVWAIGTGLTPEPEQVQAVHSFIRKLVANFNKNDAEKLPILYGGSVNEKNARQLFEMMDVDGGLIGGASLNARQFVEIVKCIN